MEENILQQNAVDFRRHFHRYPELACEEVDTQRYICSILDKYHVEYKTYKTGIIAQIGHGERCVAFRADMDGLAVEEQTGLPFASERTGMMHACGHDMHLAMLLAAITAFKEEEDGLKGKIKFVFQPSEEKRPGGARMLLPYLSEGQKPEMIFAQHVSPEYPTGTIAIRTGAFFSSSNNLLFSVKGKGTHAAAPQQGSDPILAVSCLVQFYQTLITKFRDPLVPAVISVTAIHGGTANNVIPDRVDVRGTVRTQDEDLRRQIFDLIDEKSAAICSLYGCTFERDKTADGLPVLMNAAAAVNVVKEAVPDAVCAEPQMLGEDFAIYLEQIPGAIWLLGVNPNPNEQMPALHSPLFAPDEAALKTGSRVFIDIAHRFFKR